MIKLRCSSRFHSVSLLRFAYFRANDLRFVAIDRFHSADLPRWFVLGAGLLSGHRCRSVCLQALEYFFPISFLFSPFRVIFLIAFFLDFPVSVSDTVVPITELIKDPAKKAVAQNALIDFINFKRREYAIASSTLPSTIFLVTMLCRIDMVSLRWSTLSLTPILLPKRSARLARTAGATSPPPNALASLG